MSQLVLFHFALCLAVWLPGLQVAAQSPLGLSIEMNVGQTQLTVTGAVGTACQIQWSDNFSGTNIWFHLSHCVLPNAHSSVVDLTSQPVARRFYRAVWTPSTNLVWISPGTFIMGSPTNEALRYADETQHTVTISRGFWMGKYLVTQEEYLAVTGSNPSYFNTNNGFSQDLTRPVENVSWSDATNYCALRTQQERTAGLIPSNYVYRLPTESEWEYGDRAGTSTAFYLGSALESGQANFNGHYEYDSASGESYNSSGIFVGKPTPVGSYAANGWGLYDMVGNMWEWCQDWYGIYPAGVVVDPQGAVTGSYRVSRGGAWNVGGCFCRSAERGDGYPGNRSANVGMRVVLGSNR